MKPVSKRLLAAAIPMALAATVAGVAPASAQEQKPKNLKVLPPDTDIRAVRETMANFTRALGVRCTYCHVGTDGQPQTMNYAVDEKPEKEKAREMMRMVGAINGEYLAKLASRKSPKINVGCATCHHGVTEPR